MTKDKVFANAQKHIAQFSFNENVAQVFEDMISRSVPGYELTLEMLAVIAQRYSQANSHCYDIGCSLGASSFAMRQAAPASCNIIGIDNSEAMIKRAQEALDSTGFNNMQMLLADVRDVVFKPASLIACNFTLQFIPIHDRLPLLQKLAAILLPGGALILSEKIKFSDTNHNDSMIDLYHAFKKGRGYSDLEIAQKRTALENVLVPETLQDHIHRLTQAGFTTVMPWYQCFNFCSMIAIK